MRTYKLPVTACIAAFAASVVIAVSLALPSAVGAQVIDRVIASVDGQPVTTHDIKVFSASNGTSAPDPNDPNAPGKTKEVLKALISQELLQEEVKKFADQVTDTQVENYIANFEQQNHVTEDQLRAQLSQTGVSYDEFRKHARLQLETMTMIDDEVRKKINIPAAELKAYYDAHPDEFKVKDERYKLAQILIAVPATASPVEVETARAKAESIHKRAVAGDDFAALAKQYSDDDSKAKGGELGSFAPGDIMEPIEAAIANLNAGQISPVARTKYGFHILKLEEHDRPGLRPFAEVSPEIRDKLMTEKAKDRFQHWIDNDLAKQHYVELLK
jgi:peptidyl-prolyl cis-trans isomerase SurA